VLDTKTTGGALALAFLALGAFLVFETLLVTLAEATAGATATCLAAPDLVALAGAMMVYVDEGSVYGS
jgi:hypothetical protein